MLTLPVVSDESRPPTHLGRYRVIEQLGRGGNGAVFRAVDAAGAVVAVKTITRLTEHGLAGLRAEIHALKRVQHRGIIRVFDDGADDGWPWFAMELLEGETLASYAARLDERSAWTVDELRPLLQLIADLCAPLAMLHDSGIVHRDLKPENIFLVDGAPVILDLGLAFQQSRGETRASVEPSSGAGTPAYMAPEQLTRQLVDARTDLYALGCILFELLVGRLPSRKGEGAPSRYVGGIPRELDALVESLLQRRARDRIGNAGDVSEWITKILEPSARTTRSASPWLYRPGLSGRREVLAHLSRGLDQLYAGHGAFVVIEGESGIGKTHIAFEVARIASTGCIVIPVTSEPDGGTLACWRPLFERVVDRVVVQPASVLASVVARHFAVLRTLDGVFARLPSHTVADARPTADEVCLAIRDLIGALGDDRPVILLFDDLQWADELTRRTLELVVGPWLARRRVLLLATCRTDEVAPSVLALVALRELVADMLGIGEPPDAIVAWIAQRAEGNPFLAAEYLRLLVDELPMARELALPLLRVTAPSAAQLEGLPRPASVRDLVMRRLRALDPTTLDVAELLAVLGGTIDASTFAVLETERRDAMFELHRRQIIEPTADGGRRLLHDRMRVVVCDQLAATRLRELHRRAAELLLRTPASELPSATIARHFMLADLPAAALPHLERAGELALSRAAYESAARHFEDARAIVATLSASGMQFSRLRRAHIDHGSARASYSRGDLAQCEQRVRDALAHVPRSLPRGPLGWLTLVVREGAASLLPTRSDDDGDDALMMEVGLATSMLPFHYFFHEEMLPVVGTALLSANLARRGDHTTVATGPVSLLAAMAGLFRMPGVARRYFDEAQAAGVKTGDHREAAQAYALESHYQGSFARWPQARRSAQRAIELCEHATDPWLRENAETTHAHVDYFTGDFAAARRRAELIEQSARDRLNGQHEVWGLFLQARSDIPHARWDSAHRLLEAAEQKLAIRPELLSEVATNGMLARVQLERGDVAGAEAKARWVNDRVKGRLPVAYPSLVGYDAAARVLRELLAASPSPARWRAAREIGLSLWRFAAVYPVAVPAALLHTAHLMQVAGWSRIASHLFVRGAARAERMGMPYEQAQLLLGAARATAQDAGPLDAAARQILDALVLGTGD
ncbi:MAG: protein kinase [Proteobacteria bacterium]|nr:protein kinase [Pseudomonadota bacterium]